MSKTYHLKHPDGRAENITMDKKPTKGQLKQLGFDGYEATEIAPPPPMQLNTAEMEEASLNAMSRAEFMAEVMRRVDAKLASGGKQ